MQPYAPSPADRALVEFWFDFSSPYAYFASLEMDGLGERTGAAIVWRPFMLGSAFKATGTQALTSLPLKGDYARHDWRRIARLHSYAFELPTTFPQSALAATRMYYWIEQQEPAKAVPFAKAVFERYFTRAFDLSDASTVSQLAAEFGFEMNEAFFGSQSPEIKELAKALGAEAIARGAFGAPFFFVDGEPFWGWDRIPMIERWLTTENENRAFWGGGRETSD